MTLKSSSVMRYHLQPCWPDVSQCALQVPGAKQNRVYLKDALNSSKVRFVSENQLIFWSVRT